MKTKAIILAAAILLSAFLAGGLRADTYDGHTLVAITVPKGLEQQLYACRVDIVGRRGEIFKALLTPEQLEILPQQGFKVEVLSGEMADDRRRWGDNDEASKALAATAYYTASKFNATSPPAGSLMEHLLQLYNAHPDICRLYNLGATQDGAYDIIAMKVSKNPDTVEAEPKIRIYGNIHGDEKGGCMVACDVLDTILAGYTAVPQDAVSKRLVDETEMWFIPMGNPYGNAHNTRYNGRSVDLNRNFWGPAGSDAPPAWSEKETQIIRDLTETATSDHAKMRFTTSLSFHEGDTVFNSVWNYTHDAPTDEPIFWSSRTGGSGCGGQTYCPTIAPNGLAEAYEEGCTMPGFWFTEGYDWYQTKGDTNDWSYGAWTDLDTTVELNGTKSPPASQIPTYCAEHRQAVLNYMMKTFQGIHGVMTDQTSGSPLDGTVTVTCTASSTIPVPYAYQAVYTDPAAGDFHRVLQPGTYTVACQCSGYMPVTVSGVVVTAGTKSVVNCPMGKTGLKYGASSFADSCSGGGSYSGDGVLDPGEDATLTVTLNNPGTVAATGVQAILSTSTPGVTVSRGAASFADVPGGGTGTSVSPSFQFRVGPSVACGTVISFSLHMTSAQGAWDDAFSVPVGQAGAGTPVTVFAESFDSTTFPPSGWSQTDVSGTAGSWSRKTTSSHPTGITPHTGAGMAVFNSYTASSGNTTRLARTTAFAIPASAVSASLTFWLYHETGNTSGDQIQAQVSTDGTTWLNAGSAVPRYDGSTGWKQHTVSLGSYIGQTVLEVGLLGISAYGNDCHVDDVSVAYTPQGPCVSHACSPLSPPGEAAPGATYAAAQKWTGASQQTWPVTAQATSYRLYRGTPDLLPGLLSSSVNSCLRYEGAGASASTPEDPAAGSFYWYLVTGVNAGGEGTAGSATTGTRRIYETGTCP